jgi:AbiV family abortive infection protein
MGSVASEDLHMKIKDRSYDLTDDLLCQYRNAALINAQALLEEATLLLVHEKFARAYFLSVSCIEESGKAVQAFDGLGRNLKDSAVVQRLKLQFEDHSQKVTSAFSPLLEGSPDIRHQIMDFVRIMVDLKFGREASMYTDINAEKLVVTTPQIQIREKVASDCVRLAGAVLVSARAYAHQSKPKIATRKQDAFFALRPSTFQKIFSMSDFWEYYVVQIEKGNMALEVVVTEYNQHYLSKGDLYHSPTHE